MTPHILPCSKRSRRPCSCSTAAGTSHPSPFHSWRWWVPATPPMPAKTMRHVCVPSWWAVVGDHLRPRVGHRWRLPSAGAGIGRNHPGGARVRSDCLYPKRHQGLAMQILEQEGLLVSELAPQQGPLAEHFLAATVSSVACRWGHWWWKRQNRVVRSSRPVMRWSRARGLCRSRRSAKCTGSRVQPSASTGCQAGLECRRYPGRVSRLVLPPGPANGSSEAQHNSELPYADLLIT